jgi:hypothetical protein
MGSGIVGAMSDALSPPGLPGHSDTASLAAQRSADGSYTGLYEVTCQQCGDYFRLGPYADLDDAWAAFRAHIGAAGD